MGKVHWSLLALYLITAAGYGGWRGKELWSDWVVWCFLIPPFAGAVVKAACEWRDNPYRVSIYTGLVMTAFAVVAIGGQALLLAWVVALGTERLSANAVLRAIIGAGMLLAVVVLMWATRSEREPTETLERDGPETMDAVPPTDR